jgi:uncharacterized protein (DUF58 family)
VGAAALALLAPLALITPSATSIWFLADVAWVLAFLVDAQLVARHDLSSWPVVRDPPPAFSVGRTMPVSYRWNNPADRPIILEVREQYPSQLAFPDQARVIRLPARGSFLETLNVDPRRRGKSVAGRLFLRIAGPLGLCLRQGLRELPWKVTVYPDIQRAALRALPSQAQRRREAGFRNLRRIGEGRMFESLKEWVPGEDTRAIDWKASGRRGKLMARQYEVERRQHVMIVLDAGRMLTAEIDGKPRLESAIDAALDLAHAAAEHDDNVGLLAFADAVLTYIPPTRGKRALRVVLDALAGIEGRLVEPDYPAAFAFLAARSRKRGLTVLFTDLIDRTASEAVLAQARTLRPRHLPLAVTLRDPAIERLASARPETSAEAFERAAAEELLEARAGALAELRGHGVLVLDVLPDGAARAVVQQYERFKRRAMV